MKLLKYDKDQGMISIEVTVTGVPIWSYDYNEDQVHSNSNARNAPKEHSLGKPHEFVKPSHEWTFKLVNPADFKVTANVGIIWYQEVNGEKEKILEWTKKDITIKGEDGEITGSQLILFPQ